MLAPGKDGQSCLTRSLSSLHRQSCTAAQVCAAAPTGKSWRACRSSSRWAAPATTRTDAKGEFTLTTWRPGDGAVAGDHVVSIENVVIPGYTSEGLPIEINVMPQAYQDPKTSGLNATIKTTGPNVLSFEVTGPRREAKM